MPRGGAGQDAAFLGAGGWLTGALTLTAWTTPGFRKANFMVVAAQPVYFAIDMPDGTGAHN